MAEFFTRFSCLLDVGSAENAARALAMYNEMVAEAVRVMLDVLWQASRR